MSPSQTKHKILKISALPVVYYSTDRSRGDDHERVISYAVHGVRNQDGRFFTTEPLTALGVRTVSGGGAADRAVLRFRRRAAAASSDGQVVAATG